MEPYNKEIVYSNYMMHQHFGQFCKLLILKVFIFYPAVKNTLNNQWATV